MSMIAPGDRMPFCAGMAADRQPYSFDHQAGRAAILVLGGALGPDHLDPVIDQLAMRQPELCPLQADMLVLLGFAAGPQAWISGPGAASGLPVMLCQDDFFTRCGMAVDTALVVVIDRASRVVARWTTHQAPATLAQAAVTAVAQLDRETARDCPLPAPVLPIPGLFDPNLCAELIAGFESGGHFDSGVSAMDPNGKPTDTLNPDKKRRRDWMLQPGADIHERVLDILFQRCGAEIKRAYQADITHADRVLVARYDDTGGYFRRHRDNRGETVAFRQFALSVNLNADYQGGHLLFPEFNDHRYRPGTGGGIIFSTSLLHEATPVTRGNRYVLLTFLHDAKAEARRVATLDAIKRRAQPIAVPA
jgi:hypothetical protein